MAVCCSTGWKHHLGGFRFFLTEHKPVFMQLEIENGAHRNEWMKLISPPPGRSVLLEQPRKSGSKVISHMLSSHGGEIFLHVLSSSRSILEDPPSISEGCGGRVTDYRITVRVFLSYTAASLTWQQMQGTRCGKEMLEWIAWSSFLYNQYLDRYLVENTTFVDCYACFIKYFMCQRMPP